MTDRLQEDLSRIDQALIQLRRFFDHPADGQAGAGIEMSTLLVLEAVARDGDPATISDVADRLGVAPSTASRLVARAERAGMVARAADPSDRRWIVIHPTEAGAVVRTRAVEFRLAHLAAITAQWTNQDTATFARLLERFAAHAGPRPPTDLLLTNASPAKTPPVKENP